MTESIRWALAGVTPELRAKVAKPGLTQFLLARIAEDEAAARDATAGEWAADIHRHRIDIDVDGGRIFRTGANPAFDSDMSDADFRSGKADALHIVNCRPARVLADCAAKREIVKWFSERADVYPGDDPAGNRHVVLRLLARPYADHPDYRDEWRSAGINAWIGVRFHVAWSAEDSEFVATCSEYPSLSWLAHTPAEAIAGLENVIAQLDDDA